jgi:hypothetical protein
MESKTVYFEKTGKDNTDATLKLAKQRADELGIKSIVVASNTGDTAIKAVKIFKGFKVIMVSHVTGFVGPDKQELSDENKKLVESKGGIVLTTTHAFAGLSRAMRNKHDMFLLGDIVADSGLIRTDEDVICIGGSGRGADTACVIKPVNAHNFFDLKVKEIICKPWVG